ncbi:TetR family transcriptional regulator [Cnuibacter physcomitrellae]|nr:TetR family transcriptional regulator [Cnuibacter physcomitrellae]GGI42630.1 TetR family transcriptional regulator [Cnuibacter physcomitrellae]
MSEAGEQRGPARPSGRRGGDSVTRNDILDAALTLFARLGYDATSVRAIAAEAGVDPALVRHFFGGKETLFATAMAQRSEIPDRFAAAFKGDPDRLGRRVAGAYLGLWEDTSTRPLLLALARSATTSDAAGLMLQEILGGRITGGDQTTTAFPELSRPIILAASQLLGVAFARYVLRVPQLAELDLDELVDDIAPTIQRYLSSPSSR